MSEETKEDCPHITLLDLSDLKHLDDIPNNQVCSKCGMREGNWVCVQCGFVGCAAKSHIKEHCKTTSHNIEMKLGSDEFFCATCDKLVYSEPLALIKEKFKDTKEKDKEKEEEIGKAFAKMMQMLLGLNMSNESGEPKIQITQEELLNNLKKGEYKNIVVLTGAGISVNAGIPDFRTPGTGLYSQLEKYDLPMPEAVFSIDYFTTKPEPFFKLAKEMFAKKYLPTYVHYFIRLLQDKNILLRNYTQNIDNLEADAGVREELLVQAHGTYTSSHCIKCKKVVDNTLMMEHMAKGDPLFCSECEVPCKPDIVFFGEGLPKKFFANIEEINEKCDLLIVIGSSMVVMPFCSLPERVKNSVPRLIINRELPEMFDVKSGQDIHLSGDCDTTILELIKTLGWEKEFDGLMKERKAYADKYNLKLS